MKALTVLTVALLTSSFVGCVSCVNSLFTGSELILNKDLLGDWSNGESQLSFSREGENAYIRTTSDDGEKNISGMWRKLLNLLNMQN